MKNKSIAASLVAACLVLPVNAYAEEQSVSTDSENTSLQNTQAVEENIDTLPPPTQEDIENDSWNDNNKDPDGDGEAVPKDQDEPESWAIVDENGNVINTITCDIDFCGSGWIPTKYDGNTPTEFARVVLQAKRDPSTGRNNGGHFGQYNFSSNTWTNVMSDGGTYYMPIDYGQDPVCLENCPVYGPPEGYTEEAPTNESYTATSTQEPPDISTRNSEITFKSIEKNIVFNVKTHKAKKIFKGKVWVIAKNNGQKVVFTFRVKNSGGAQIVIPEKYRFWDISVNYRLKKSSFGKRIFQESIVLTESK